jgi:hypothetical protein
LEKTGRIDNGPADQVGSGHSFDKSGKPGMNFSPSNVDLDSPQDSVIEELLSAISLQRGHYRAEHLLYASDYQRVSETLKRTARTEEEISLKKREIEEIKRKAQDVSR